MPSTDPIAHMLTVIRNGLHARKREVILESSNMRKNIARILDEENYITEYTILEPSEKYNRKFEEIKITLRYLQNDMPAMLGIERVSKPGRRVYVDTKDIPVVYNHTGIAILSTNKGVMTDSTARKENVGGEYLCKIW